MRWSVSLTMKFGVRSALLALLPLGGVSEDIRRYGVFLNRNQFETLRQKLFHGMGFFLIEINLKLCVGSVEANARCRFVLIRSCALGFADCSSFRSCMF